MSGKRKYEKTYTQVIVDRLSDIPAGREFTQRDLINQADYTRTTKNTIRTTISSVMVNAQKTGVAVLVQAGKMNSPAVYRKIHRKLDELKPSKSKPKVTEEPMISMSELAEQLVRQFAAQNHSLRAQVENLTQELREANADCKQLTDKYNELIENYRRAQHKINDLNDVIAKKKESDFVPLSRLQDIYRDSDK